MIPKQDLLKIIKKETATTVKVMRAFPESQEQFKPHERSSDALQLIRTFVLEMYLVKGYGLGQAIDPSIFKTYLPKTVGEIIADFEKETNEIFTAIEALSDDQFAKKVEFGGTTFTVDSFILMMFHDQIHHRGQLTVYVRMAGGKVPSIYGPSADDSSTNLG